MGWRTLQVDRVAARNKRSQHRDRRGKYDSLMHPGARERCTTNRHEPQNEVKVTRKPLKVTVLLYICTMNRRYFPCLHSLHLHFHEDDIEICSIPPLAPQKASAEVSLPHSWKKIGEGGWGEGVPSQTVHKSRNTPDPHGIFSLTTDR